MFGQLPITAAVCKISCESNLDNFNFCECDEENYHEPYWELEQSCVKRTKDHTIKPILNLDKIYTNYTFSVFDFTYQ